MSAQIAETILSQIKKHKDAKGVNSGANCMVCWGVENRFFHERSEKFIGGLMLHVNGFYHTGIVNVMLAGNDTYTLQFIKDGVTLKESEGIYYDQLTAIIDSYVESNYMNHHEQKTEWELIAS